MIILTSDQADALRKLVVKVLQSRQNVGTLVQARLCESILSDAIKAASVQPGAHSIYGRMLSAMQAASQHGCGGKLELRLGSSEHAEWIAACQAPDSVSEASNFQGVPVVRDPKADDPKAGLAGLRCIVTFGGKPPGMPG